MPMNKPKSSACVLLLWMALLASFCCNKWRHQSPAEPHLSFRPAQVNTKPGARKAKKGGKKKKDDPAVEHEDLDDEEEGAPQTQELEDAAGLLTFPAHTLACPDAADSLVLCWGIVCCACCAVLALLCCAVLCGDVL